MVVPNLKNGIYSKPGSVGIHLRPCKYPRKDFQSRKAFFDHGSNRKRTLGQTKADRFGYCRKIQIVHAPHDTGIQFHYESRTGSLEYVTHIIFGGHHRLERSGWVLSNNGETIGNAVGKPTKNSRFREATSWNSLGCRGASQIYTQTPVGFVPLPTTRYEFSGKFSFCVSISLARQPETDENRSRSEKAYEKETPRSGCSNLVITFSRLQTL